MKVLPIILFMICIKQAVLEDIPLELEKNQKFCGTKLTRTLGFFCSDYNTPNRARRYIATECCQSPCTIKYMLDHYCARTNPHSLAMAKKFADRKKETEVNKNGTVARQTNKVHKPKIRKKKSPRKRRERKCKCERHRKSEVEKTMRCQKKGKCSC